MNESDRELISRYLDGDSKSLEILIRRHMRSVYYFVYHYAGNAEDAEDITQETFVKAWRSLQRFDRTKNFKIWIFAIAKNAVIDFLRKKKAVPFSALEDGAGVYPFADTIADPLPSPDAMLMRRDMRHLLFCAAEKLKPQYRKVFLSRFTDSRTFREIAESFGEPLHTVKSRYRRALITLKDILQKESAPNENILS